MPIDDDQDQERGLPPVVPPAAPVGDLPLGRHGAPDLSPGPLGRRGDTAASQTSVDALGDRVNDVENQNRRDTLIVAVIVGIGIILLLIFGYLVLDQRATLSELQDRVTATDTQRLQADTTQQTAACVLYRTALGTYSTTDRADNPAGPDAYDATYRRLVAGSDLLRCDLAPPAGLGR